MFNIVTAIRTVVAMLALLFAFMFGNAAIIAVRMSNDHAFLPTRGDVVLAFVLVAIAAFFVSIVLAVVAFRAQIEVSVTRDRQD